MQQGMVGELSKVCLAAYSQLDALDTIQDEQITALLSLGSQVKSMHGVGNCPEVGRFLGKLVVFALQRQDIRDLAPLSNLLRSMACFSELSPHVTVADSQTDTSVMAQRFDALFSLAEVMGRAELISAEQESTMDASFLTTYYVNLKRVESFLTDKVFGEAPHIVFAVVVQNAKSHIAGLKTRQLDLLRRALEDATSALAHSAHGLDDGGKWTDGFNGQTAQQLILHAQETLMTMDGPALKRGVHSLEAHISKLRDFIDIHGDDAASEKNARVLAASANILRRAQTTVAEAGLVYAFLNIRDNTVRLKNQLKAAMANGIGSYNDDIHELLRGAVDVANRHKFKM